MDFLVNILANFLVMRGGRRGDGVHFVVDDGAHVEGDVGVDGLSVVVVVKYMALRHLK